MVTDYDTFRDLQSVESLSEMPSSITSVPMKITYDRNDEGEQSALVAGEPIAYLFPLGCMTIFWQLVQSSYKAQYCTLHCAATSCFKREYTLMSFIEETVFYRNLFS